MASGAVILQVLVRITPALLLQASSDGPTPRSKFNKQRTLLVIVRLKPSTSESLGGHMCPSRSALKNYRERMYPVRRGRIDNCGFSLSKVGIHWPAKTSSTLGSSCAKHFYGKLARVAPWSNLPEPTRVVGHHHGHRTTKRAQSRIANGLNGAYMARRGQIDNGGIVSRPIPRA